MGDADTSTLKVGLADKLYNVRSQIADLGAAGNDPDMFWSRFRGKDAVHKRRRQLWYGQLADVFRSIAPAHPELQLIAHFCKAVEEFHEMAGVNWFSMSQHVENLVTGTT